VLLKLGGRLSRTEQGHSPFDVVAWHGNYAPFKYDLSLFAALGSVKWDHPDPSILTVLTCPYDDHGNALADFVVFPGRWDVIEHSLRPPYLHRNAASEFNGIVRTPAPSAGYVQGCYFMTPMLTPHGVAADAYARAVAASDAEADRPRRIPDESLWIMFESSFPLQLTAWALEGENRERDFRELYRGYRSRFDPSDPAGGDFSAG
jgi:homogentisate 1,2-dioxygenase